MSVLTERLASLSELIIRRGHAAKPGGRCVGDDVPPGLDALVTAVQGALAPVSPSVTFRTNLGRDLAAIARQKYAPLVILQRPPSRRRQILIGAAVSSAVSVAGLIAIIWRHRSQQNLAQRAL